MEQQGPVLHRWRPSKHARVPAGHRLSLQSSIDLLCWTIVVLAHAGLARASSAGVSLKAGDAAFARGELGAALGLYSRAVDADPKGVLPLTKRAAAYSKLGEHAAALRDLTQAIQNDNSSTQAWLHRAKLHKQLCAFTSAEADLRALLDLRPSHKGAVRELQSLSQGVKGLSHASAASGRDPAAARGALTQLYSLSPECVPARLIEARLLMLEEDHSGVVALMGALLKSQPGQVEALVLRGQAYMLLGDLDLAKRHYGEALRHDPDHKQAQAAFKAAKALARLRSQAEAAGQKGHWAEAEPLYVEALGADPGAKLINTALWLGLCTARLNLKRGGGQQASQACEKAVEHDPGNSEAAVLKVRAHLLEGDTEAAVRAAAEARQRHPNTRSVLQVQQEADKARRMAQRKDYYAILGIGQDAPPHEVKQAYRKGAQLYHPDKAAAAGLTKEEAEGKFTDLAEAYEVLSDEEKRAAYDRGDDVELGSGQAGYSGGGFPGGFPGGFAGGQQFHFHFG